jgi:uncharacterized protein YfbU (UPF0304 family)
MARTSQRQMARERLVTDEAREMFAMFCALRRSYDALPDKSGIDESQITFDGFDANDDEEYEYLQVAHRLASISRDIQAFDSHFPRLRGYRMMMQAWRGSRDRENLTKEDIIRIINV